MNLKRLLRWPKTAISNFDQHNPKRELALFLLAIVGCVLSVMSYLDGRRTTSIQRQVAITNVLDEIEPIVGAAAVESAANGTGFPNGLDEAERKLRDVLIQDPKNPRAHFLLLLFSVAASDFDSANSVLKRMGELTDDESVTSFAAGIIADARGDLSDAEKMYRTAIREDPSSIGSRNALASNLVKQNRHAEARDMFKQLVNQFPRDCEFTFNLAIVERDLMNKLEALRLMLQARKLCPSSQRVQMNLAHALLDVGRYQDALEAYENAAALEPSYAGSYAAKAEVYLSTGEVLLAEQNLQEALKRGPHQAATRVALGNIAAQRGDFNKALQEYLRAELDLQEYPQDADVQIAALQTGIALSYLYTGQLDLANNYADKALSQNQQNVQTLFAKASVLRAMNRSTEADSFDEAARRLLSQPIILGPKITNTTENTLPTQSPLPARPADRLKN